MSGRSDRNHNVHHASRYSVVMTGEVDVMLHSQLLRSDGQEDLCLAVYQPSNGAERMTAILADVVSPLEGETEVHGNVSFTGDYVLRAAATAARCGGGVAILHSHPFGSGWQRMSQHDKDAEASFANIVREITGLPLVGLTLAGSSDTWSARFWSRGVGRKVAPEWCESVRVIGDRLAVSWNPDLRPPPSTGANQVRTASCWGSRMQADIARLRILVVGAGTLGMDVAVRLAATGVQTVGVLDFDSAQLINLDRLIGATLLDVLLYRSKLEVTSRLLDQNATALDFRPEFIEGSICEPSQLARALDFDLIFCCVDDHPWPRSVINTIAYTDLIPVIDGGIHIDAFADGGGLRNATWRSHVLRPGRPCMACNGQIDLGKVNVDRAGLLDDESYIANLPHAEQPQGQNVAVLAVGATASLLAQFVSFVAAPAGMGEPGPLRYSLSTHWLEHVEATARENCPVEKSVLAGDRRLLLVGGHVVARQNILRRQQAASHPLIKVARVIDDAFSLLRMFLTRAIAAFQAD